MTDLTEPDFVWVDTKCSICGNEAVVNYNKEAYCLSCIPIDILRKAVTHGAWRGYEQNLIGVSQQSFDTGFLLCPHHYLEYKKIQKPDSEWSDWASYCDICALDAFIEECITFFGEDAVPQNIVNVVVQKLYPKKEKLVKELLHEHN